MLNKDLKRLQACHCSKQRKWGVAADIEFPRALIFALPMIKNCFQCQNVALKKLYKMNISIKLLKITTRL